MRPRTRIAVEKLSYIKDAIEDNGPRDSDGELIAPFSSWVKMLNQAIVAYNKWEEGVRGWGETPQDGQETA